MAANLEKITDPRGSVIGEIQRVGVWYVARDARGRLVPASPRVDNHESRDAALHALRNR